MRNFKNILRINLRLNWWKEYYFVRWKSVNTIQRYVFTYVKLFLSLNGKTSQQTKHSSLVIAKCSMMSGTCKITSLYPMICLKFSHKLGNVFFLNWEIWRNLEFRVIFSWHRANHIVRSRLLQNVLTSERYHVHSTLFKTLRRKTSISSLYYKNQKH